MSGVEKSLQNFLQRWSRRKLAMAERVGQAPKAQAEEGESAEPSTLAEAQPRGPVAPPFDPASLPPIESINAASDVRPFLAPGVPIELTRAALRRAWVSDPTIRDFIGLAENQWDFTKPDAVPGFGSLDLTPELRRMLAGFRGEASAGESQSTAADIPSASEITQNSGKTRPPDPSAASLQPPAAAVSPVAAAHQAVPESAGDTAATEGQFADTVPVPAPTQRKHGRALPQ